MTHSGRKITGASIAELGVTLALAVPVCVMLFELVIVVIIAQATDGITREAARIAAGGDPAQAMARVQRIIDKANQEQKTMSSVLSLRSCIFDPRDTLAQENALIPFGGTLNGDVTVQLECRITPWAIAWFNNGQPLLFKSEKVYPFTYNVPNTAGGIKPVQ
jgi:hypothetical protein